MTVTKNYRLLHLYAIGIVLLILQSMNAWFLWGTNPYILESTTIIAGLLYTSKKGYYRYWSPKKTIICILIISTCFINFAFGLGVWTYIRIPFLICLMLPTEDRLIILRFWTIIFALLLLISFPYWCLVFYFPLPNLGIISPPGISNESYIYLNYGLCLINIGKFADIVRFSSVFLEPGHLSMIGAFTVFANHYNLKNKYVLIIFVISGITFSLAGFILLTVGYILSKISIGKVSKALRKMIPGITFLTIIILYGVYYNGGNNLVNEHFLSRLEYDEEKVISGNNRVFETTNEKFAHFLASKDVFLGYSLKQRAEYYESGEMRGAGYKMYIMQKGLIGTIAIFLAYILIVKTSYNRRFMYCMLVLYFFAFIQRAYPLWYAWLFIFLLAAESTPNNRTTIVPSPPQK